MSNFCFVPLTRKKKINNLEKAYIRIQAPGNVIMPKLTLFELTNSDDLLKTFFLHLYYDKDKRAIAFFVSHEMRKDDYESNIRPIKPMTTKKGYVFAQFSIQSFVNSLPDVKLPSTRLYLKKTIDKLIGKELYYFEIPKNTSVLKNDKNQNVEN